jgi:xanthine dehydrogenase accessory factor
MKRETLDAIRAARRNRQAVTLVTDLVTGEQRLENPSPDGFAATLSLKGRGNDLPAPSPLEGEGRGEGSQDQIFTHTFTPTPRLIVVGAVHIAQKLVPLARLADFAVDIVDPRAAFASPTRFPDVGLHHAWPDAAVAALAPDVATAIVTLTHDPKLDDPALIAALRSPVFYIGALGSRKTHGRRLDRLREAGFGEADLARIHAPVGLPIGAVSPGEIAVSIMAEIVAARHGRALQTVPA